MKPLRIKVWSCQVQVTYWPPNVVKLKLSTLLLHYVAFILLQDFKQYCKGKYIHFSGRMTQENQTAKKHMSP